MSEKRFTIGRESNFREEWYAISCDIKDGDEFIFVGMPKESAKFVVDKLNEQQDTIERLERRIKFLEKLADVIDDE